MNKCKFCGRDAFFQRKDGSWCCSKNPASCPEIRIRIKNGTKDKNKGKEPWNKGKKDIYSKETIEKIRIGNKKKKHTETWKEEQRQKCLNGHAIVMIKSIKKISNEEIRLRDIVKKLYPSCEFQYPIFKYAIDIAIPEYKIAIEFDGYYHFDSPEKKEYYAFRRKKIEGEGWILLSFTMFDVFPDDKTITDAVEKNKKR